MSILNDTMTLAGGVKIPRLGFGTWQIPEGEACYDAVSRALEAGYRHIDTARAYGNEKAWAARSGTPDWPRRRCSSPPSCPRRKKGYDAAWRCFEATMEDLRMETLDLYLIHAPPGPGARWARIIPGRTSKPGAPWRRSGKAAAAAPSVFPISVSPI